MAEMRIIRTGRLVDLQAIAAVARHRSFRRAAVELGFSTTALSRMIAGLEERLAIQLFVRTTRSVSLTAAGDRFLARIAPALDEIGVAIDEINDEREAPSGLIRINCSSGAASFLLEPILLPFLVSNPAIAIELGTDDRLIDIVQLGYDAGVRQAGSVPSGMISIPITGPMRFLVVGSPGYLAAREPPFIPGDLHNHQCIRIRLAGGEMYRWEFRSEAGITSVEVPGMLTLQDPSLMRQAAISGAGLAYIAAWRVAEDIASGRLVSLLDDFTPEEDGLCLYHPSRRYPSAALRTLIEAVRISDNPD